MFWYIWYRTGVQKLGTIGIIPMVLQLGTIPVGIIPMNLAAKRIMAIASHFCSTYTWYRVRHAAGNPNRYRTYGSFKFQNILNIVGVTNMQGILFFILGSIVFYIKDPGTLVEKRGRGRVF